MSNPFESTPKRGVGFFKLLVVLLIAVGVVQYSVVERIIGRYLALHNAERPLEGQAWTAGVEKEMAAGRSEMTASANSQRGELAQWIVRSQRGRPTTLPLYRFATLWEAMPEYLRSNAIDDDQWRKIVFSSETDRVRPSWLKKGIEISFMTANNRSVDRVMIRKDVVDLFLLHGQTSSDTLTDQQSKGALYSGANFSQRMERMTPPERTLLWRILSSDLIVHRPIAHYSIERKSDHYSVLWVEYTQPAVTSIAYVIPAGLAIALGGNG